MESDSIPERNYNLPKYEGINFSPYTSAHSFANALAERGTNIRDAVFDRIDNLLYYVSWDKINPQEILDSISEGTRKVDVARNGFKAKFSS